MKTEINKGVFGMEFKLITSYSRKQAIEDGVLIDVTATSRDAGLKVPVAITAELDAKLRDIPQKYFWQGYGGRLWDMLCMGAYEARRNKTRVSFNFEFTCHHTGFENETRVIKEKLKVEFEAHGGDSGEPVITIGLV